MAGWRKLRRAAKAVALSRPVRPLVRLLTRAGMVPDPVWNLFPVKGLIRVRLPGVPAFGYLSPQDDLIGRTLYWRGVGAYEAESLTIFARLARESRVVLDIGANTGLFTLAAAAANPAARVVAFEPLPAAYQALAANVRANRFEGQCETHAMALADHVGRTQFHVPTLGPFLPHSASLETAGFRGMAGDLVEVEVTTVDAFCEHFETVDLAKIDVENFEDKVLSGMRRVLADHAPSVIIEVLSDGPYEAVEAILAEFGYRFFRLSAAGPQPAERIQPDESEACRNYLCVRRDEVLSLLRPGG